MACYKRRKTRKRKRKPTLCRHCRRLLLLKNSPPLKRKRAPRPSSAKSSVNNSAAIDGAISGLINIIVQIPVNVGDSTTLNESDQNSISNAV